MKELEPRGSFFEMGRQYGKSCRREIWLFSKAVQLMVALPAEKTCWFFEPNPCRDDSKRFAHGRINVPHAPLA